MPHAALRPPFESDLEAVTDAIGAADWAQLRGRHVFLTGGTGFVGKWLLASLLHAGRRFALDCRITVLSRNPQAFRSEAPFLAQAPGVSLLQGDVRSFAWPDQRFDLVIHAATDVVASATPLETFDTCVQGTRRVLDLAVQAGAQRVLLVSSGAMYGRQPEGQEGVPESWLGAPDIRDARSAYGEGKRATEWLGAAYSKQHGLDVRVARCFAFLGPYLPLDKHFALGNFLRDAMAGQPIVIQGDGTALRSYLYAADMAAWLWAILLRGERGGTYNVGGGEAVSIAQLARRIAQALASPSAVTVQGQAGGGMAPDRYVPDTRKALGALALGVPLALDEAIRRTAAWHRAATDLPA
ncbi:NAD-dependent epimerase/dehydratase family protein [Xylophilus rhododendri]|uniref:NAD-dependent epimerase/dehydratase family protein n=1 Tax=Xylophilus rhododendri TaxID=2697032 RepID=A0A857JBS4_9BURK|nr:NAD-dependent epimerase/dehydratase family protein [Xylophilus rhododendri]QHJ00156.1 NAD-dependent epimerase/dehydratase family protein [Xylophilus rhododendri]